MNIALFQYETVWEEKEKNYRMVQKTIKENLNGGVKLFLLPEMSFTGFSMNTDRTKESEEESLAYIKTVAKEHHIGLGFGWVKDTGELCENHYTVVSAEGEILSDYVKIHPFSYSGENKKFRGGEKIVFFELSGIIFSTFICYDLRFPEIFQSASKKADVILVPANWPASRQEHWKCLLRARAIENQVYIFGINTVGKVGGMEYSGDSCVITPDGEIKEMLSDRAGILYYDLKNDVYEYRKNFPVKRDRRENIYKNL